MSLIMVSSIDYTDSECNVANYLEFDLKEIGADLLRLAMTPGPTQAAIQVSCPESPRDVADFPIFREVKKLLEKLDLQYKRHLGNLVVYEGIGEEGDGRLVEEIGKIPTTLGAHLDEITYLATESMINGSYVLMPICAPPARTELINTECKIVGFRHEKSGELSDIGFGSIKAEYLEDKQKIAYMKRAYESLKNEAGCSESLKGTISYMLNEIIGNIQEKAKFRYLLETEANFMVGDMVIQDYNRTKRDNFTSESLIHVKALDDRAGCIAVLYALKELATLGIPAKAVLTTSEEGVPKDVSWGRLVRPTYQKYCTNDGINIICDGIDGARLTELERRKGQFLDEAMVLPYTSLGTGGGDPYVFSSIRDVVLPRARKDGISALTTTSYVSRSYDAAIMHDFPLIGFIDWVNGKVMNPDARCHLDETIKLRQIGNITGMLVYAAAFFHRERTGKPNRIFR